MTLKELFLDEVKKGCQVVVSISGRQEPIAGIVTALDSNLCRIQTQNGASRICLDSITSYDILEEQIAADSAAATSPAPDQTPTGNEATVFFSQPKPIQELTKVLESTQPGDFAIVDWDGIYRALTESTIPQELKREIDNARSTFKYIRSHLDQMHQKELDERMHNLRAKILVLCKKYPDASRELYCMIAAMYFITKRFEDALKYFEDGNDVYSAAYAAYRGGNSDRFTQLINQYVADPSVHDPFLYRLYADDCLKTQDITALCGRVHALRKQNTLSENDRQELLCLCAAGYRITQVVGLPMGWVMDFAAGNELKCIDLFLDSLPNSWKKNVVERAGLSSGLEQLPAAPLKSTIFSFDTQRRFGWINGTPSNHFFYIAQVNCKDALREVLAHSGMAQGLEVTFQLGVPKNPDNRPAAYDIQLTERGADEAAIRLARTKAPKTTVQEITGYLQEYNYDFGKIYVGGEAYNVIEAQIADPYLKGYLAICSHPDIKVKFTPKKDKRGKRIANKVRIDDTDIQFSDADVREMLRSKAVTQAELDQWDNRNDAAAEEPKPSVIEDYYLIPYVALEPVKQPAAPKVAPAAPKPDLKGKQIVRFPVPTSKNSAAELPALEPLPLPEENPFANLPIIALNRNYYEEAHKYLIKGSLKKAEELYIQALSARDRTESAVSDLALQVFLRGDASRIADAYQVVDAFKDFMPREKEILLKISICQKSKERPYQILLCHLINELVKISEKANTKLHFLSVQGKTLRDLGEYQMALTSFAKWHQVYENEVQYRGQSAVSQYANTQNYIKTGEAVCYYFLGDQTRAKNMAKEVLRISSDNTTAQSILDDTLNVQNTDDFLAPVSEDEYRLDNIQISNFAKAQLTSAPISTYVRKNVENGKFTGSAQDASTIIRMLQDTRGKTPAMRRDILQVAANIISQKQAQAASGDHRTLQKLHLTESDQKKYIARSMAAFGDAILDSCSDTDSARYGFLQAIELLDSSEEDYTRSMKHYIESFYNAQQEMAQIVRNDLNSRSVRPNFSMLSEQEPLDHEEFALGMFELCRTLKKAHPAAQSELVRKLNEPLANNSWAQWFDRLSQDSAHGSFKQKLECAEEKYTQYRTLLSNRIEQLPSQFFSQQSSKELTGEFANAAQSAFLSVTDKNRIRTLQGIIQNFSGYFTTVQFQHRSNLLQTTENDILKLIQLISSQPTQFSYDVLLPNLQKIHSNLQQATEEHYRKLPPDISITTTDVGAYVGRSNEVNLHLTISNGGTANDSNKRQMADNISIDITRISEGAEYLRMESDFTGGIFGGEDAEIILVFRITDPKILLYGIDLSLRCSYRYNESRTISKDAYVDYSDTIVIRQGNHAQIYNPYAAHIGQEMSDPAMFVGREQIIKRVIDTMVTERGYNYGMGFLFYGQTRAGKSSIRVHLGNRIRDKFPSIILADLGNLDPDSFFERSFYCDLLFKVNDELKENHPDLYKELLEHGIEAPPDSISEADLEIVLAKFKRYFSRLSSAIRNKTMIVVMADEFSAINTAIQKGRVSNNFMQSWKAMLENYGLFTICFGQDDSPAFILQNQNAFGRMTVEMITYLEKPYAIELMEKPIMVTASDGTEKSRYSPSVTDELYRLTSGSAYLIVKLCSLLVDYLNEKGADYVTSGILHSFLKTRVFTGQKCISEGDFEPQINDRSDPSLADVNATVLLRISRAAQSTGWADLISISDTDLRPRDNQTPQRRKDELLKRLQARDVIEIEEGRRCRIKVTLLNQWLLMKYGTEE